MNIKLFFWVIITSFSIPLMGMGGIYALSVRKETNYNSYSRSSYSYKDTAEYCLKEIRRKINKGDSFSSIEKFVKNKGRGNALAFVVSREGSDLCARLLEMGADPDGDEGDKGQPLLNAVRLCKKSKIVELLLQHDASITEEDPGNVTLLTRAINAEYNSIVSIAKGETLDRLYRLLAHKDSMKLINCKNKNGSTALGEAIYNLEHRIFQKRDTKEAIAIVDLLLANGENPDLVIPRMQNGIEMRLFQNIDQTDYEPFSRYIPQRHQQFKKDCADRLAGYLRKLQFHSENKNFTGLPVDMIVKIANYCWDCDEI